MFQLAILALALLDATGHVSVQRRNNRPRSDYNYPAQQDLDKYVEGICRPDSSPTRPCGAVAAIVYQCTTGLDYDPGYSMEEQAIPDCENTDTCQSAEFQHTCFCQSQFLDTFSGCIRCYLFHGGAGASAVKNIILNDVSPVMAEYCDSTAKPTGKFDDVYYNSIESSQEYTPTETWSDPVGSSNTDVSFYYTPSLPGAEAWSATLSTIVDWSGARLTGPGVPLPDPAVSTNSPTRPKQSITASHDSEDTMATSDSLVSLASTSAAHGPSKSVTSQPDSVVVVSQTSIIKRPPLTTSDASALHLTRINITAISGILGIVVVVLVL